MRIRCGDIVPITIAAVARIPLLKTCESIGLQSKVLQAFRN